MAEEEDDAQKTEDPTPKKLTKSRKKGQVAVSREINSWAIILAGSIGLFLMAPGIMRDVSLTARTFIEFPHQISIDVDALAPLLSAVLVELSWILAPLVGLLMIAALAAGVGQVGLMMATEKLKPEISKISPVKGFKKILSVQSVVEFVKGIVKLAIVGLVSFGLAIPLLDDLTLIPYMDISRTLERIHAVAVQLAVGTLAVMTVVAVFDYAFQKQQHLKKMRMSKQEVKDEQKQSDGDPLIKARIRKIRTERAHQRMMAAVPDADVVITNPTHYSVALSYDMDSMEAPKLVAKGVDSLALRIRLVAQAHDIPLVENPPLCRALYAGVDIDEEIPPEHYKAVAEIIGYVMGLRGGRARAGAKGAQAS